MLRKWIASLRSIIRSRRKKPKKTRPFRLMELPPEIRTMILREMLIMPRQIRYRRLDKWNEDYPHSWLDLNVLPLAYYNAKDYEDIPDRFCRPIVRTAIIRQVDGLPILRASKTIYREAMPMYYSNNTFAFDDIWYLLYFVRKIGPNARVHLARIELMMHCMHNYGSAKAVEGCVGLRELTLSVKPTRRFSLDLICQRLRSVRNQLQRQGMPNVEVTYRDKVYGLKLRDGWFFPLELEEEYEQRFRKSRY